MLNLDMIGRNDPNQIQFGWEDNSNNLLKISQEISKDIGINLKMIKNIHTSSDHLPFLNNDIPVIFYFDGGGNFAHKTTDTWEKILPEKIERVARLCFLTAYNIADRD